MEPTAMEPSAKPLIIDASLPSTNLTGSNLTAAQRQLWLGQKLAPEVPLYNMAFLFTFTGQIDSAHFQAAFQMLIHRCDALRTVIEETQGRPQQRVLEQLDYTVPVLDFRTAKTKDSSQNVLQTWAAAKAKTRFNLSERLFESALIESDHHTVWYLNQHHLITDMVSLKRLYEVMGDLYARSQNGTLAEAPKLPAYADVSLPQPTERAINYWREQTVAATPLYHREAVQRSSASYRLSCSLSPKQTKALKKRAMDCESAALTPQLSLFNLVSGIVLAYLHRIGGSPQVSFSTPAQGRPSAALKETIGVFIELFPLSVNIEKGETFASLLTKVSESSGKLLRHAQPGTSEFSANRNTNVVLNFLSTKISDFADQLPVQAQWIHSGASDWHHHLRILVHDFDNRGYLQLHFDFNNELFSSELKNRAPKHFLALVDAVLANRTQPITEINLLSEAEKAQLEEIGQCQQLPITQSVVQQFETQVAKTPEAIALTAPRSATTAQTLTYQQLNTQANQLAHSLQHQGIQVETPIALFFRRSADMLVAILGVLKAGGTYIPLDPGHPASKNQHILQDTQARWVLTHSSLVNCFNDSVNNGVNSSEIAQNPRVLPIDTLELFTQPSYNLPKPPTLNQLAYCLYTSGSTGQPKGVEIEHRALANYVQWAQQKYVRGRALSFPLFSPLTFDLTVTSIFVPLLSGGQVVIYPEPGTAIDLSLQQIFQDNAVDIIKLTPSHLALVQGLPMPSRIKTLILGGEDLKTSLAADIYSANPELEIYNEYGPTEATVGCMIHRFLPAADTATEPPSVSIGKPAAGADIWLLDKYLNRVPLGDIGEIFIGGPGLARGYLKQPELSAQRFVMRAGRRLYRTGDLGRWAENGQLCYLGRCDRQVKIHGVRVELGDVEAALSAHPQVHTCVVTTTPETPSQSAAATQLAAYYISADKRTIPSTELRDLIAQRMPSSMIPTHFTAIECIPLTANGKVDLSALPSPQADYSAAAKVFAAPQTPQEETLAQIWQQVFGLASVSRNDNFFDLGGDSILAIQIAVRMHTAQLTISPNQIFQHATIAALAAVAQPQIPEVDPVHQEKAPNSEEGKGFPFAQISSSQMDKLSALLSKADGEESHST